MQTNLSLSGCWGAAKHRPAPQQPRKSDASLASGEKSQKGGGALLTALGGVAGRVCRSLHVGGKQEDIDQASNAKDDQGSADAGIQPSPPEKVPVPTPAVPSRASRRRPEESSRAQPPTPAGSRVIQQQGAEVLEPQAAFK